MASFADRMNDKSYDCAPGCPIEATLDLIDGKWKAIILYHLLGGTLRFGEMRKRLSKITQRMLTRQLRELEEVGLISRTVFAQVPPRVDYALTARGRTLEPVIRALWMWGNEHLGRGDAVFDATSNVVELPRVTRPAQTS
ncbi:winged helix-turn-helix transcriptional regulator [Bradyrhizobium prioriisuperbiae]|uniref:winged helix-turn-helix transcriptional regulator n=1 Tax=Bradyrhizobium prioriisuperbiae TaxID=2854389 RepID=UPI0038990643